MIFFDWLRRLNPSYDPSYLEKKDLRFARNRLSPCIFSRKCSSVLPGMRPTSNALPQQCIDFDKIVHMQSGFAASVSLLTLTGERPLLGLDCCFDNTALCDRSLRVGRTTSRNIPSLTVGHISLLCRLSTTRGITSCVQQDGEASPSAKALALAYHEAQPDARLGPLW